LIHVAVGVIYGPDGHILISRRAEDAHQGGFWEFPGGKIEPGETLESALQRELLEELNITLEDSLTPVCKIHHDYGDKQVLLDVCSVRRFSGTPTGMEGQPLRWVRPDDLRTEEFPAANRAIIRCLQLTDLYRISPDLSSVESLSAWLDRSGSTQNTLLQVRLPTLDAGNFSQMVSESLRILATKRHVILNCEPGTAVNLQVGGCHLNTQRLASHNNRPVPEQMLLGASCHSLEELLHAQAIGVDYALLSPVASTISHPGQKAIGWEQFGTLAGQVTIPVYALGGMRVEDLPTARKHGARGIAGISFDTTR